MTEQLITGDRQLDWEELVTIISIVPVSLGWQGWTEHIPSFISTSLADAFFIENYKQKKQKYLFKGLYFNNNYTACVLYNALTGIERPEEPPPFVPS